MFGTCRTACTTCSSSSGWTSLRAWAASLWAASSRACSSSPQYFLSRLVEAQEMARTRFFLNGNANSFEDVLTLFDARFLSELSSEGWREGFFDAAQAEDAGAHQFELDAIKMRFSSAFDLAKQENFEKQRSILRVLTQIRDNLTMAVGAESGFDDRRRRRRTRRRTIWIILWNIRWNCWRLWRTLSRRITWVWSPSSSIIRISF